jgi:hypothetical protein
MIECTVLRPERRLRRGRAREGDYGRVEVRRHREGDEAPAAARGRPEGGTPGQGADGIETLTVIPIEHMSDLELQTLERVLLRLAAKPEVVTPERKNQP